MKSVPVTRLVTISSPSHRSSHHEIQPFLRTAYERTIRWSRSFGNLRDSIISFLAALLLQPALRQSVFAGICIIALAARNHLISPTTFTLSILAGTATYYITNFFFEDASSIRAKPRDFGRYRPRFYFCWTTHARFGRINCRFTFPLLYVGFHAQMRGSVTSTSRMFSILPPSAPGSPHLKGSRLTGTPAKTLLSRFTFFTIDPSRYFNPSKPFDQKLHEFLRLHGKNPLDYPHIYVLTTPACFGVAHNPVSFYHLYTKDHKLAHTVFEVNNTFDGCIVYLLTPDTTGETVKLRNGYSYAGRIEKVLHISPFNQPTGHYEMQILDPLRHCSPSPQSPPETAASDFDVLMVVFDDAGKKTMACNVGSRGLIPWDMATGGRLAAWDIVIRWGFCAGLALPRTMWRAAKMRLWGARMHDETPKDEKAVGPRRGVWKSGMEGK